MSNTLVSLIDSLKNCIPSQNASRALQTVNNIDQYFKEELSLSERDLSTHKVFDSATGLIAFLGQSQKCNKILRDANVEILKLIKRLIIEQTIKVNDYAKDTAEICLRYATSSVVTAKEKELAIAVLQELLINNLCGNVNITEMLVTLVQQVFNYKKQPGRFLQDTYELVGLIARDYPTNVPNGYDLQIRDAYFNTLETQLLKQEEILFLPLTGALKGFTYFLVNFAPSTTEEINVCQRLYACIKKLSDPGEISDHTTFRASLTLLTDHGKLFSVQLFQDYQYWHNTLLKWLSFQLWEDRKVAMYAMTTFHREFAAQIDARNNPNDIPTLNFFINFFKSTLQMQTARSYEIRIAIRGFGLMAGPCKALLSPIILDQLLTLVMQRTEYAVSQKRTHNKDILEHYPDFVQALSQIMSHIKELTCIQISSLQTIIIALIKDFYLLSKAHHLLAVNSLMKTFSNLLNVGGTILDDVLENIVLQGVIWTCSHKLIYDAAENWQTITDWKEHITYKSFLPLWNGLMADIESMDYNRPHLKRLIFKHFIQTLFVVLDKLNLSTEKRIFKNAEGIDQELYFCNPNYDLQPMQTKDFHIFFNIVELYRDVIATQTTSSLCETFTEWTQQYCETIMLKSIRYPLISGFLKLLRTGIRIAEQLNFFNQNDDDDQNCEAFYQTVKHFLKTIIIRVQQTSGELQIACLELLFTAPAQFLCDCLMEMLPVFVIGFTIGHSMMKIANFALNALEKLTNGRQAIELTKNNRDKLLKTILPCLELYLQSREHNSNISNANEISIKIVETKQRNQRAKKTFNNLNDGSELQQLQLRIILYLGKLEPVDCQEFISQHVNATKLNLVKLDTEQHLRLTLKYADLKPTIYLDTLVPRICTLASASGQRTTKLAACELIHATILYLIGINKQTGGVWSALCKQMLHLSCDADIAVHQMFEPLLFQTIHYMSHPSQLFGPGVDTLVDCLMECISHPTNTSVRDMSARGIREFITWALKQSVGRRQLDASPANVDLLLQKLKLYNIDTDANKRRGAALAFNNLYRVLREEERCIDKHWLDLLHTFSMNYLLTENLITSAAAAGDVEHLEEVKQSLSHVIRVLYERRDLFNQHKNDRCLPYAFVGENGDNKVIRTDKTLKTAVLWLFEQCNSKNENYRRKCMEMFIKLAPCVSDYNSVKSFVNGTQTIDEILRICEGASIDDNGTGIAARPNLKHLKTSKQPPTIALCTWLQYFLTALENYSWFIGDGIVQNPKLLFEKSSIFHVIDFYLKNICTKDVIEIIMADSSINGNDSLDFKSDLEAINRFERLKCMANIEIVQFFTKILPLHNTAIQIPQTFLLSSSTVLIELIIQLIFTPQDYGFDAMINEQLCQQLSQKLDTFCQIMNQSSNNIPNELKQIYNEQLFVNINARFKVTTETAQEMLNSEQISIQQINSVNGLTMILKKISSFNMNTIAVEFIKKSTSVLLLNLFEGIKQKRLNQWHCIHLPPKIKLYANQLIEICFLFPDIQINELIFLILNQTKLVQLIDEQNPICIMHGQHFLTTYRHQIFNFFQQNANEIIKKFMEKLTYENISYISRIFIHFLLYLYKYRRYDAQCLRDIVRNLLQQWPLILDRAQATTIEQIAANETIVFILIELMSHIALICPFSLNEIGRLTVRLSAWILSIISSNTISLELKSRTIFLLPCLIGSNDTDENAQISNALKSLQLQYFPLESNEFIAGSLKRSAFVNIFKMLLDAMIASKSTVLLQFIINTTVSDTKHILESSIQMALGKFVQHQLTYQLQVNALRIPFEMVCNQSFEPALRQNIVRRFLLTMIEHCCIDAVLEFFAENIKRINEMTDANYGIGSSGWNVEHALVNRIVGYQLLEMLYATVDEDILQDKNCKIGIALLGINEIKTGREISRYLLVRVVKVRTEIFITDNHTTRELFRIYQCAAYNTACAVISNIVVSLDHYNRFLFHEIAQKNEFIWSLIVDCTNDQLYTAGFNQEFDDFPQIKERFVAIRKQKQETDNQMQAKLSAKYLQSQTVFDSSLSQDITKMDLSFTTVRSRNDIEILAATASANSTLCTSTTLIALEELPINNHECMSMLCGVIRHMIEKAISPTAVNPNEKTRKSIGWVDDISSVIGDTMRHKNIRIFLVKLVLNCRNEFKHYAGILIRSLLKFLCDECCGNYLNYFNMDVIALIIEWTATYESCKLKTIDEKSLASQVLKFAMENAWHNRREIFRHNLEMIKLMIETWCSDDAIQIPKTFLNSSINRSHSNESKENVFGLQLNGIVLANDLVPWIDNDSADTFIRSLYKCMENDHAIVYQPAGHLIGMCLNKIDNVPDNQQESLLSQTLFTILDKYRLQKEDKFTKCLYAIHKNYPKILDSFLVRISKHISLSTGAIRRNYLEMFLARMDIYDREIYRELFAIGICDLLKQHEYQLYALHIINKSLQFMSIDELTTISTQILHIVDSKKRDCRDIMYEIFMFIYEKQIQQSNATNEKIIVTLLNGLNDPDEEIQKRLLNFWTNEQRLSNKLDKRLLQLFSKLYEPNAERNFLSYCVQLLLEPAIQNPDSKRQIFEHQSDTSIEMKLTEYDINVDWKTQNSSFKSPLFVESQQRELFIGTGTDSQSIFKQNWIRESCTNLAFEPTQDPTVMSQTSNNFSLQTQSSMLFNVQPQMLDRRSCRVATAGGNDDRIAAKPKTNFDRLRQRFLRDKEMLTKSNALKAIEKNAYKSVVQSQNKEKREKQVKLYRRYRIGDYPDLLINSLALLLPLVGLAKYDNLLARQLIVSIFASIKTELIDGGGGSDADFIANASNFIQTIIKKSKYCEPLVFATIMEIALNDSNKFNLPPDIVATFSNTSNQMAIGIMYLENRLNLIDTTTEDHDENMPQTSSIAAKRTNTHITSEQKHWLKLAEMYHALNEHDIVASIFSDKMPMVRSEISKAIECELNNDYKKASEYYQTVIKNECKFEQDFAYQSYFNCLAQMADWSTLETSIAAQYENVDELWTDDWNQEILLPHVMQRQLREILLGNARSIDFLRQLEVWTQNPERLQYIMLNFGEELMMFHIANRNYRRARYHSEERIRAFIAEWSHLNVLSNKVRSKKLLTIRNVAEMNNYAQLLLDDIPFSRQALINNLKLRWSKSQPNSCDSTLLWDTLIAYRTYACALICDQTQSTDLLPCIDDMNLTLLDLALAQQNLPFSDRIIARLSPHDNQAMDKHGLLFNIARSKHQSIKICGKSLKYDQMKLLMEAWQRLEDEVLVHDDLLNDMPIVHIKALTQMSQTVSSIFDVLPKINNELHLNRFMADILHYASMSDDDNIDHRLFNHARNCLTKSVEIAENHFQSNLEINRESKNIIGETYEKLAQFCIDHNSDNRLETIPNLTESLIRSILRGMQYESKVAQQQFPLLLQLQNLDTQELKAIFQSESENVPEWMFLKWVPQIISAINFGRECYLDSLFLRIAHSYPAAIYNPFHLSLEQYKSNLATATIIDVDDDGQNRKFVADVLAIIENSLAEKFNEAMKHFCVPETKLIFHLHSLMRLVNQKDNNNYNWVKSVKLIVETIYERRRRIFGSSITFGRLFNGIDQVESRVKNLASLRLISDKQQIITEISSIAKELQNIKRTNADIEKDLQQICQWLNQCHWYGDENYLELPGQYTGEHMPIIQNHVKIIKFGDKTTVFVSLRKPVKITIYGSNGKSYDFLIKYGEDLRLDQRIQQLLQMMSRQLQNDRMCRQTNLSIHTYHVIPINYHCGLLQWVNRTIAMQQIIAKSYERHERNANEKLYQLTMKYRNFIIAATQKQQLKKTIIDPSKLYGNAVLHYEPYQIVNNIQAITNDLSNDIIRYVLLDMSVSPESFFMLRNNFATSLAAMNIAHWILGIGDRHLSNILLNLFDGKLIGIDFGVAFGSGTRNFHIPELIPFRLTPHFVSALNPLGISGLIMKNMCHALRTFRQNRKLLMAYMEVFIREPTIDWLDSLVRKDHENVGNDEDDDDDEVRIVWKPLERIEIVERKLNGANPKWLFETEIRDGVVSDSPYAVGYLRLLEGDKQKDIRAQLPNENLTVEQQVKCLINMATDPALLGISYEVFKPWI